MPKITFTKTELEKVKKKRGIYSGLSRRPTPIKLDKRDVETLHDLMKPVITDIIRDAFYLYARAHGCKSENLILEWTRFNKFLQKKL